MIDTYLSKKPQTMDNITGYQYIDQPTTELLETLPSETQKNLTAILKKIYMAGRAEGYSYRNMSESEVLNR